MSQYSVEAAQANLSNLIEAALAGEEVVIARGQESAVRLEPVARKAFRLGLLDGELGAVPDFSAPLPAEELDAWEGR